MFSPASIAVLVATALLPLSQITVHSAPVTRATAITEKWCTGPNGTGTCTTLPPDTCTNTPGIQSLILNADADCDVFPLPNCDFDVLNGLAVSEFFSDDSQNMGGNGFQSVNCGHVKGTVNGAAVGSPEDKELEAEDTAAGIAIVGSE
ncbi:hypothetical protein C8R45DRAFT_942841 [Mycena sanguinolenta]|nr:hypothetical protein C8R45DRAFT_942841 [Mycena sanguinolenta]